MSRFRSNKDRNPKDIWWMSSPLAVDLRENIADRFTSIKGSPFDPKERKTRIYHNIRHWTLKIGENCYEIAPVQGYGSKFQKFTDLIGGNTCKYVPCDVSRWHVMHKTQDSGPSIKIEERKVGQTTMSHKEIDAAAKKLWDRFNNNWYGLFTQNCQNFASLLYVAIATRIPDSERSLWDEMPDPVIYALSKVSNYGTAGQIVLSSWTIGATALTATEAAAIGPATALAATEGAGAAAATGIQAGGVTTTAAAGSTSSTASATVAKGGAAGSGKVGIGAKLAAAGHTKAAAIAGKGAFMLGPAPAIGVGTIAASVYFRKKYKKHKEARQQLMEGSWHDDIDGEDDMKDEDFTIEGWLEKEDFLFKEAEDGGDEVDKEIEDELAKELEMTRITSEPAQMPDQQLDSDSGLAARSDPRREQTLS